MPPAMYHGLSGSGGRWLFPVLTGLLLESLSCPPALLSARCLTAPLGMLVEYYVCWTKEAQGQHLWPSSEILQFVGYREGVQFRGNSTAADGDMRNMYHVLFKI